MSKVVNQSRWPSSNSAHMHEYAYRAQDGEQQDPTSVITSPRQVTNVSHLVQSTAAGIEEINKLPGPIKEVYHDLVGLARGHPELWPTTKIFRPITEPRKYATPSEFTASEDIQFTGDGNLAYGWDSDSNSVLFIDANQPNGSQGESSPASLPITSRFQLDLTKGKYRHLVEIPHTGQFLVWFVDRVEVWDVKTSQKQTSIELKSFRRFGNAKFAGTASNQEAEAHFVAQVAEKPKTRDIAAVITANPVDIPAGWFCPELRPDYFVVTTDLCCLMQIINN